MILYPASVVAVVISAALIANALLCNALEAVGRFG